MKANWILALSAMTLLSACGGGGGGGKSSYPRSAQEPLTASSPSVVPGYGFSEGMGLLLIRKAGQLGVCTSFVISPTQVMTNSHCLDDISLTESCGDNVVVHVKSAYGYEFRRCQRIITRSHIDGDFGDPDYAVFELDASTTAKPMSMSREGVQELAEVTVESVDYTGSADTLYANRKISKCTPHMNAAIGNYAHAKSSIIPIFGDAGQTCKVIPGNSGSPMKNAAGKVISVVFATLDRDALRTRLNVRNPHETALATNLACIKTNLPWFDSSRPADCDSLIREESRYLTRLQSQFDIGKLDNRKAKTEELKKALPGAFSFSLEEKQLSKKDAKEKYAFNFKPVCMNSPSAWSEDEKLKIRTSEAGIRRYSTTVSNYSYSLDLQFDEYLRPEVSSVLSKTGYYELIVENIDAKQNQVKIRIARSVGGKVTTTEQVVPLCQKI